MKNTVQTIVQFLAAVVLAVGALGSQPQPARALALVVNSLNDVDDTVCNGTHCSLREAINEAVNIVGSDTITFSVSGTIHLTSTLQVFGPLTIDGGNNITISGDTDNNNVGDVQIMQVYNVVTLQNLTLTRGKDTTDGGGAIKNHATLTIDNSTISNSSTTVANIGGGGIFNLGALTITNSAISGNSSTFTGGGIYNAGSALTIANSTISGNSSTASQGGGIFNGGSLTITDSTFSNNQAFSSGGALSFGVIVGIPTVTGSTFVDNQAKFGGAIYFGSNSINVSDSTFESNDASIDGGGIYGSGSTSLTVTNSTFSANTSVLRGGAIFTFGDVTTTNVTISDTTASSANTGGGIYSFGILTANNTIIANSVAGGDCVLDSGGSVSGTSSNNLIEDAANACGLTNNVSGNIVGSDPLLGPLQNNGGATKTHALLFGSPAIDKGTNTGCPTADQRGLTRPLDGDNNGTATCDIGAYEFDPIPTVLTVNRVNPNPTAQTSVTFTVTFSESVNNVDAADFTIWQSGVSGATVSGVSGSGATRTATVNTGAGSGTIRLDVKSSGTGIVDSTGNPLNGGFTSGQTYTVDKTSPAVTSITRADANPTAQASVDYTVTFSEPVTFVDAADYTVWRSGITGSTVSAVNGSGATYTVTVNTGTGSGSLRLDLNSSGTGIVDAAGNAISGGFTGGQVYTVNKTQTLTLRSVGANDGWILESTETSNKGGSLNSSATTFRLGDFTGDKQYRAILHFDTSTLPDTAVITKVTLKIKQSGTPVGTNPFTILNALKVDIRKPRFGSSTALVKSDFQAAASQANIGAIPNTPVASWYTRIWTSGAFFSFVNKTGSTQFRLYFAKGDNDDNGADYMKFFSGNAPAGSRPQLIIEYYIP